MLARCAKEFALRQGAGATIFHPSPAGATLPLRLANEDDYRRLAMHSRSYALYGELALG
jgi:hypothetical protein